MNHNFFIGKLKTKLKFNNFSIELIAVFHKPRSFLSPSSLFIGVVVFLGEEKTNQKFLTKSE